MFGQRTDDSLLGEHAELYATVDLFRAESDFRLAPLAAPRGNRHSFAISGLAAPATAAVLVATPLLGALLVAQGLRREAAAADRVVDAMVLGTVTPPEIEKLRRAASRRASSPTAVAVRGPAWR